MPPPKWTSQAVCVYRYRLRLFCGFWICNSNGDERRVSGVLDDHPQADTPDYPWEQDIHADELTGEIVVGISIKRNIANEVELYLETTDFRGPRLYLFSDNAILSAAHANRAVEKAKQMINESAAAVDAKKIRIFIAAPAQFALFLGHRLNAMGGIQCYEYRNTNVYVPTCLIST